jgi:hypothetical protein
VNDKMRRILLPVLLAVVIVGAVSAAVVAGGDSAVTAARLEHSVPLTFSRQYVAWTHLQGRHDVTVQSMHAKTMCEKGGASTPDVGPGSDWNCLVSWDDPEVPMPPEGYAKLELNVHTNACYTAGSSAKYTGVQTMTDKNGKTVNNPVYEFDGCFDPNGDNTPSGVTFPSVLIPTSTAIRRTSDGSVPLVVLCNNGANGCAGTVKATAGGKSLGSVDFSLNEVQSATLTPPGKAPANAKDVTYTFTLTTGYGSSSPLTLPIS